MNSGFWDRLDPGFGAPLWLAIGLAAMVAVVLLELGARRRRRQAVRYFAASHLVAALTESVSPLKRLLKRILLIAAVGLVFVAMARPHLFNDWRDESRTGLDILMAVDCSKSMLTEDVKPNRLERAKLALSDFADHFPDNRLGLIAFAGDAFLQCPLTLDQDAFQTAVRELDTDTIPRPGTDIAVAIEQAVQAFKSQSSNLKILVLVTDGEDLEGRAIDAAKAAAQSGLTIYTVGVGTPAGGLIPETDPSSGASYHHDASGQIVQSKLDENTLREIATSTGGAYVQLGQRGEGLQEIYEHYIARRPLQHFEERREKIPIEQFEWPLTLAILFLVWEFLTSERAKAAVPTPAASAPARRPVRRRTTRSAVTATPLAAAGILVFALPNHVQAADAATAERDYKSGQYADALQNYKKALENDPDRNDLQYDRGDAAYKSGDYNEAEDAFRKTLSTPDLGLQEKTYYNLGNTQFKHGEAMEKVDRDKTIGLWEQSLKSYESALKLKTSADAKYNYDVVKKKLEQLKQQQQQDQQNKKDQEKKDQSGKDSKQNQGKGDGQPNQQPQGQPGQDNPQTGGQDPGQAGQQPGDQPQPDKDQPGNAGKDPDKSQLRTYSGTRNQDKQDPGTKSRQEAEDLLDSLKDDEHHVTARTLNGNSELPPPPPSGKDW